MGRPGRGERGSALIMAILVVTMLTVLGTAVYYTVSVDLDAAGAERSGDNALYIAEAGIHWGLQELELNYDIDTSSPDFSVVLANPAITGDAECPDASCKIFGWVQLHPGNMTKTYGEGTFRVAVQAGSDTDTLVMRSFGKSKGGGKRMVEVVLTPVP